jgi:hypothetical protein
MVNHPWAMIMRNLKHSVQLVRVLVESLLQQRDSFMQRFQRLYWNDMSNHPWAMIMHNLEHSVQLVRVLVELLLQQRDSFMQRFHLFTAQRFFHAAISPLPGPWQCTRVGNERCAPSTNKCSNTPNRRSELPNKCPGTWYQVSEQAFTCSEHRTPSTNTEQSEHSSLPTLQDACCTCQHYW